MSEQQSNQLVVIDNETGELMTAESTLDSIARKTTGGLTGAIKTSLDLTTTKGREDFDKLRQANPPNDHKQNEGWYGRTFVFDSYVCNGYLGKKDSLGSRLETPEPRIRTTIRDKEGKIMVSSSSYLYESLMQAIESHRKDGVKKPLKLRLVKSGPTDQIQRVYD